MADLLIRNIPIKTLDALKLRAKRRDRSVAAEVLDILERNVDVTLGATLVTWATSIGRSEASFEPAARFVREMRDER